jgi:hypothetical protein
MHSRFIFEDKLLLSQYNCYNFGEKWIGDHFTSDDFNKID